MIGQVNGIPDKLGGTPHVKCRALRTSNHLGGDF